MRDNNGFTAFDYLVRNYGIVRDEVTEPKTAKEFMKMYNVACQLNDYDTNDTW